MGVGECAVWWHGRSQVVPYVADTDGRAKEIGGCLPRSSGHDTCLVKTRDDTVSAKSREHKDGQFRNEHIRTGLGEVRQAQAVAGAMTGGSGRGRGVPRLQPQTKTKHGPPHHQAFGPFLNEHSTFNQRRDGGRRGVGSSIIHRTYCMQMVHSS